MLMQPFGSLSSSQVFPLPLLSSLLREPQSRGEVVWISFGQFEFEFQTSIFERESVCGTYLPGAKVPTSMASYGSAPIILKDLATLKVDLRLVSFAPSAAGSLDMTQKMLILSVRFF